MFQNSSHVSLTSIRMKTHQKPKPTPLAINPHATKAIVFMQNITEMYLWNAGLAAGRLQKRVTC